jgi:adsorption protein B
MIEGNLARIAVPTVRLYLGVYSNDMGTRDVAMALTKKYSERVRVIVNTPSWPHL